MGDRSRVNVRKVGRRWAWRVFDRNGQVLARGTRTYGRFGDAKRAVQRTLLILLYGR